jgi:hypothetical protein
MVNLIEKFDKWVPIRIYKSGDALMVDWCWMGEERFEQPFFDDTVARMLGRPFNLAFRRQTTVDVLEELYGTRRSLMPAGFILHMSRCGSTLVSQMLAALSWNIVISEAPPIDSGIRLNASRERRMNLLRWIINAIGFPHHGEKHLFIKFDSWNTLDIDLIAEAFPEVPWIFLYREPVEVIVSHMRSRGSQMIPGAIGRLAAEIDLVTALQLSPEEYCARVLSMFCKAAVERSGDDKGMFVDYDQLPSAFSQILEHFATQYSDVDINKMTGAAKLNAKRPKLVFVPDKESKRAEVTTSIQTAADTWVSPLFEQLKRTGVSQSTSNI